MRHNDFRDPGDLIERRGHTTAGGIAQHMRIGSGGERGRDRPISGAVSLSTATPNSSLSRQFGTQEIRKGVWLG